MHLNAKSNEYAAQCGDLLDRTPKAVFAVFAAIAYSYASAGGDLSPEEAQDNLLREWRFLHDNGIVPQKPPSAPARRGEADDYSEAGEQPETISVPLDADDRVAPDFPEQLRPFIDALQAGGIALIPAEQLDASALRPPVEPSPGQRRLPRVR